MARLRDYSVDYGSDFGWHGYGLVSLFVDRGGSGSGYEDGDPVSVWSHLKMRTRLADVTFGRVSLPEAAGRRRDPTPGTAEGNALTSWFDNLREFRCERINGTQYRKVNPVDNSEIEVITLPTLQQYINRRLQAKDHAIYGNPGEEVFYSHSDVPSQSRLDEAWSVYNDQTGDSEANHAQIEPNAQSKRTALWIRFNDDEINDLKQGNTTGSQISNRRRFTFVWRALNQLNVSSSLQDDVLDPNKIVDLTKGDKSIHQVERFDRQDESSVEALTRERKRAKRRRRRG